MLTLPIKKKWFDMIKFCIKNIKCGGSMLKIKDNVDLKELEKFGFKLSNDKTVCEYGNDVEDITIFFFPEQKVRTLYCDYGTEIKDTDSHLEVLYDLIKADLVEKVGGDNE